MEKLSGYKKEYLDQFLSFLNLVHNVNESFWLKINHNEFYFCTLTSKTDLQVRASVGSGTERKVKNNLIFDENWLLEKTLVKPTKGVGGLFCIPGNPIDLPLKGYGSGSSDIGLELDWGTSGEQLKQFKYIENLGLSVTTLTSGSKSIHGHIVLDELIPVDEWQSLGRFLSVLTLSDPAVHQEAQAMRAPGGYRFEKNQYQELLKLGIRNKVNDVKNAIKRGFQDKNYNLTDNLSTERWVKIRRVLAGGKDNTGNKIELSIEAKEEQLRAIFSIPEDELIEKIEPISVKALGIYSQVQYLNSTYIPDITDFLSRANSKDIGGVSSHRNETGTRILLDLLGVEAALNRLSISYTGKAYDSYLAYCQACTGGQGWGQREWESIYRSNSKKSFQPAITEEGIRKRLHWLRIQHDPQYKKLTVKESKALDHENKTTQATKAIDDRLKSLEKYNPVFVHSRYLPGLSIPESAKVIAINSQQGTGKSTAMIEVVKKARASGQAVYVVTHRIQLTKALSQTFGLSYVDEILDKAGKFQGFGLCIDSMRPSSQAEFKPSFLDNALLIIDEADQVFQHLLLGGTLTRKNHRVQVLVTLQDSVNRCLNSAKGKIILLSADITATEIDFVLGLQEKSTSIFYEKPEIHVVINTYLPIKEAGRKLFYYDSPEALFTMLYQDIENGKRALVHTAAQVESSKWSTTTQEKILNQKFPGLPVLRIDSDTVSDKDHPAFGCVTNLEQVITKYNVALASPTIETGVSIVDQERNFDSVYMCATGAQSVDSVTQTLERLRTDVDRHCFIAKTSMSRIANGSTTTEKILNWDKAKAPASEAIQAVLVADGVLPVGDIFKNTWAKYASSLNLGFITYQESILAKFRSKGYEVIDATNIVSKKDEVVKDVKKISKETSSALVEVKNNRIANAINPDTETFKGLERSTSLTMVERDQFQKGSICRLYALEDNEVTPAVVTAHTKDNLYSKLDKLYSLTTGLKFTVLKDKERIKTKTYDGFYFSPDLNATSRVNSLNVLYLLLSNFIDFKNNTPIDKNWDKENLLPWFQKITKYKILIKTHLELKVPNTPDQVVKFAHTVLHKVGLKFTCKRSGKHRSYRLDNLDTEYSYVLERWLKRDTERFRGIIYNELIKELTLLDLTKELGITRLYELVKNWSLDTVKLILPELSFNKILEINEVLKFSKNLESSKSVLRQEKPYNRSDLCKSPDAIFTDAIIDEVKSPDAIQNYSQTSFIEAKEALDKDILLPDTNQLPEPIVLEPIKAIPATKASTTASTVTFNRYCEIHKISDFIKKTLGLEKITKILSEVLDGWFDDEITDIDILYRLSVIT